MGKKNNLKEKNTTTKAPKRQWTFITKGMKFFATGICLLALIAIGLALTLGEEAYLWKVQELNLFLYAQQFFDQQMAVPGGMLTWLGTYFTQYFYHPWQGVLMLCLWWALLMWLTKRTFNIPRTWAVVLLIPVALLLLTDVTLGYWIYYLKLRGHFFVATIGTTVAVATIWGYQSMPDRYGLRTFYMMIATVLLYPLMGCYGLMAALLMAITSWSLPGRDTVRKTIDSLVAIVLLAAIPHICYQHLYSQTSIDDIYRAGLPLFQIVESEDDYYIPYQLLAAFYIILAATQWIKRSNTTKKPLLWFGAQIVLVSGIVWGTWHFWFKDYNFHKELKMQRCMNVQNWQGILDEAVDLQDEPTRAMVMMKNLALFQLGQQGEMMYHYRNGAKAPNTKIPIRMAQIIGKDIYYYYGQLNFCYRWCLEDGVEFGWRAEHLKHLIRCSLVNGEYRVARKYINILKKTKFHREWAEQQERFLNNEKALKEDPGYGHVFHMLNYEDMLASDQSIIERYLMQHFAQTDSDDPIYQEQTLLSAMWMKDNIRGFWPHYMHYWQLHPDKRIPTHYQEAAYLYAMLEPQHVDVNRLNIDPKVIQSYNQFMKQATTLMQSGNTEEQLKELMYDSFGHTFFYEYYLIRHQKLY